MQNRERDIEYCGVSKRKIRNANPVLDEENLGLFVHWIKERYSVHLKKDVNKEPKPWTDDPIIEVYRFTNVRREHDRQTKYLIDNIVKNTNLTLEEKIVNNILFRYWNLWSSMESLGGPWKEKQLMDGSAISKAEKLYNPNQMYFTNVFFTSGTKRMLRKEFSTENFAIGVLLLGQYAFKKNIPQRILNAETPKEICKILQSLPGIAGFLSYQIFVDCTYIPEFPFSENEFTVAGPGCKRGIDNLFKDKDGLSYEECVFWIRDNITKISDIDPKKLMTDIPKEDRFLSVMSLENCFCEFSKYCRTWHGISRPRNKYKPFKE